MPAPGSALDAAQFAACINPLLNHDKLPSAVAVAVSGGADSLALTLLLHEWAQTRSIMLQAITVNHQLRPEAAQEAQQVAQWLAAYGIAHTALTVTVASTGNTAQAARQARYQAMADWCVAQDIQHLCVGHHAMDQAETLLMRLGRGSGLTGLTGMMARQALYGITLLRPVLDVAPENLRQYLEARQQPWLDDPSNHDLTKQRNALRALWPALIEAGITPQRLSQSAARLQAAEQALDQHLAAVPGLYRLEKGQALIDADKLDSLPPEQQTRLWRQLLCLVGGQPLPPRRNSLIGLLARLGTQRQTLHGCLIWQDEHGIHIMPEH